MTTEDYQRFPDVDLTHGEGLTALHRTWTAALWAQIDIVRRDPRCQGLDGPRIARIAWAEAALRHRRLRALLDEHGHRLPTAARRSEDLLLATGLGVWRESYGAAHTAVYAVA